MWGTESTCILKEKELIPIFGCSGPGEAESENRLWPVVLEPGSEIKIASPGSLEIERYLKPLCWHVLLSRPAQS